MQKYPPPKMRCTVKMEIISHVSITNLFTLLLSTGPKRVIVWVIEMIEYLPSHSMDADTLHRPYVTDELYVLLY